MNPALRPAFRLVFVVACLLVLAGVLLSTCHTTPAGILTKRQEHRVVARRDSLLRAARADSARARQAHQAAQRLRAAAQAQEDSAAYYQTHEKPVSLPAADSSSLPRFWADFFAR